MRRAGIALVGLVAFLLVAYAIGANVFLIEKNFDRLVNRRPEQMDIHYARAWSPWPGRVHVRGLTIHGRDDQIEWKLTLDEASFDVSLFGLARRQFDVSQVRGRGVSMQVRRHLPEVPSSPAQYLNLPPIDGPFSIRPDFVFEPKDWLDSHWDLWTITLRDVVAEDVREIWIDEERFVGEARVTGGFYLKPIRALEVGPARAEIAHGRVLRGATVLAEDLSGSFDTTVARFDPRLIVDLRRKISLSTALRLRLPQIAYLARTALPARATVDVFLLAVEVRRGELEPGSSVALGARDVRLAGVRASGTAAAHVVSGDHVRVASRFEDGRVAAGPVSVAGLGGTLDGALEDGKARGRLAVQGTKVAVALGPLKMTGALDAAADVKRLDLGEGVLTLSRSHLTLRDAKGEGVFISRVHLEARTPALRLSRPSLRDADVKVAVEGAELANVRFGPASATKATLDAALELSSSEKKGAGVVAVNLSRARVGLGKLQLEGDVKARATVRSLDADTATVDLGGSWITVRDGVVRGVPASASRWHAGAGFRGALLSLDGPPRLDAQVVLEARDARPFIAAIFRDDIPKLLVGLIDMPGLQARALVNAGAGEMAVRHLHAAGGDQEVRGSYVAARSRRRAAFVFEKGPVAVKVELRDQGGLDVKKVALDDNMKVKTN